MAKFTSEDHQLNSTYSMEDLAEILQKLERDARGHAADPALRYAEFGEEDQRALANYYLGKAKMARSLWWAITDGGGDEVSDTSVNSGD